MTDPPSTTRPLRRLLPLLALLAGCSQDSLVHISSISLDVKVAAADAVDSWVCGRSLSIEDEMSGRFEKFLRDTRDALDGRDPARITMDRVTIYCEGQCSSANLETLEVSLVVESSGNASQLIAVDHPDFPPGPLEFPASFDSRQQLTDAEWRALLDTHFHLRLCGKATAQFLQKSTSWLEYALKVTVSSYSS